MDFTRLEAIASHIDARLDKLDSKVDKLDERLDSVDKTLAVQAEQLATHIKRTDLAEQNLDMLRNDMKPIAKHVVQVEGILKFLGVISLVLTIAYNIYKLFF